MTSSTPHMYTVSRSDQSVVSSFGSMHPRRDDSKEVKEMSSNDLTFVFLTINSEKTPNQGPNFTDEVGIDNVAESCNDTKWEP